MNMHKTRIGIRAGLLITSLFGYLEWGGGQQAFLYQAEFDLLTKALSHPGDVLHPFTVIPLAGQLLLLVSLFSGRSHRAAGIAGTLCVGLLLYLMFFIGLFDTNLRIFAGAAPFTLLSIGYLWLEWKFRRAPSL